jgi:hypothetical protein
LGLGPKLFFITLHLKEYTQSDKYLQDIEDEAKAASSLGIKASYIEELPLPLRLRQLYVLIIKPNSIHLNICKLWLKKFPITVV